MREMHRFLLHNDDLLDVGARFLSPGQVGILNGWGVFTTIHVCDGVLFEWDRHWGRMHTDAQRIRVPFPQEKAWLEERLYRLIEANHAFNATLRVSVIRNLGGIWVGPQMTREFDVVAFTREPTQWNSTVKLGLVAQGRHAASPFAGTKYLSWAENLTIYEQAHEAGYDDALLLNERGEVSECTSANIFVANGNRVGTPPLSSGCLPGVTRALLLEEVFAQGVEVVEQVLLPGDLEAADEVFITSSTRELLPVAAIKGLRIRSGQGVRDRLQAAFTEHVRNYVAAHRRPVPAT
jgi:branched-chain amino acid aminotransferase